MRTACCRGVGRNGAYMDSTYGVWPVSPCPVCTLVGTRLRMGLSVPFLAPLVSI